MTSVLRLEELYMPEKHFNFLNAYLDSLADIAAIDRIILFGSCASGKAGKNSDIDLVIIGDTISYQDELNIYSRYVPDLGFDNYIATDVLVCTHDNYNSHRDQVGYVQRHAELLGVDLTAILNSKRGVLA